MYWHKKTNISNARVLAIEFSPKNSNSNLTSNKCHGLYPSSIFLAFSIRTWDIVESFKFLRQLDKRTLLIWKLRREVLLKCPQWRQPCIGPSTTLLSWSLTTLTTGIIDRWNLELEGCFSKLSLTTSNNHCVISYCISCLAKQYPWIFLPYQ
jgi:hypothetical protein